jgi:IS605 OrfB family transposase
MKKVVPTITLKVRVKDKHTKHLSKMAGAVNYVWNYCNALSHKAIVDHGKFLSAIDFQQYTKGVNKELGLHSQTPQMIGREYATRRKQFNKNRLKWRKTYGVGRSLGWIPVNGQSISWKNGQIFHNGQYYGVFDSYGLGEYEFRAGSFNEDARGRWYINITVQVKQSRTSSKEMVGIDLGCKETVTTSDGEILLGRNYRKLEDKLKIAQRAKNKKRVQNLHAKIKNRRKDQIHKFTTDLVKNNGAIFVGNVNSKALTKTRMAKSVNDAGWFMLKNTLKYKCHQAGVIYEEVNESYTTQTCSGCGTKSGPKGLSGLNERNWQCDGCGVQHDRDVNAAINILALGHGRLTGGIPCL